MKLSDSNVICAAIDERGRTVTVYTPWWSNDSHFPVVLQKRPRKVFVVSKKRLTATRIINKTLATMYGFVEPQVQEHDSEALQQEASGEGG